MGLEPALEATKILGQMLSTAEDREVFLIRHGWVPGQPIVIAEEHELSGEVIDRSRTYFDGGHSHVTVCVFNNQERRLRFLHFIKPGEEAPTLFGEIRDVSVGVLATIAEKVYNDSLVASKPLEYAARAG